MRISDARVIVTCPDRNFVTLKIVTDDGLTGVGDATLNGRELAVASYLTDHVVPLLIGRDPTRIEDTWQYLYRGAYWRRGPGDDEPRSPPWTPRCGTSRARSPGCRSTSCSAAARREGVTVYGHANGATVDEALDRGRPLRGPGLPGDPGADRRARPGQHLRRLRRTSCSTSPPTPRCRPRTSGRPPRYLDHVPDGVRRGPRRVRPGRAAAARRAPPADPDRGRPARQVPRAVSPVLDGGSVAGRDCRKAFRLIRQHTTTPIAVGEVFNTIWDCQQLIREQLIDYIRTTVVHAGGITHLRRIFDLAALHHVRTGSHGATDLSPVCMAAALHVDVAIPNFGLQEYMRHTPADRRGLPARVPLRRRLPAPVRAAGPRRRHRRGARRAVPVPAGVAAGEPPRRRDDAQLVTRLSRKVAAVVGRRPHAGLRPCGCHRRRRAPGCRRLPPGAPGRLHRRGARRRSHLGHQRLTQRSAAVRDQLAPQDGLYTVAGTRRGAAPPRVIGALREVRTPDEGGGPAARIADPRVRLVTLTVTEKGYRFAGGRLDLTDPFVRADLATFPLPPTRSAIGRLVAGLELRRRARTPARSACCRATTCPPTAPPCAGSSPTSARRCRPGTGCMDWIDASVAFPSCMVDRIVPATAAADLASVAAASGSPTRARSSPNPSASGSSRTPSPPVAPPGRPPARCSPPTSPPTRPRNSASSTPPTRCSPTPARSPATTPSPRR